MSYIKQHKLKLKTLKFNSLIIGSVGVRVLETCRLTHKQLESVRRVFVRISERLGKFWPRVFFNTRLTKKSKGSRMGKGIGNFEKTVIDVKCGQVIFECTHLGEESLESFKYAVEQKIPAKVELFCRDFNTHYSGNK